KEASAYECPNAPEYDRFDDRIGYSGGESFVRTSMKFLEHQRENNIRLHAESALELTDKCGGGCHFVLSVRVAISGKFAVEKNRKNRLSESVRKAFSGFDSERKRLI